MAPIRAEHGPSKTTRSAQSRQEGVACKSTGSAQERQERRPSQKSGLTRESLCISKLDAKTVVCISIRGTNIGGIVHHEDVQRGFVAAFALVTAVMFLRFAI